MKKSLFILILVVALVCSVSAFAADKVVVVPLGGSQHAETTYEVGDTGPAGGVVFWISSDKHHGLESASSDQSSGIRWNSGVNFVTNAVRNGFNAGQYNTERIINIHGAGDYAAQLCANNRAGGYGDWYLPSEEELYLLYLKKNIVGGFANAIYWSSTERYGDQVWATDFGNGDFVASLKGSTYRVRSIRSFYQ